MQIGLSMMTSDHAILPQALAEAAESRELDLLLLTDHSHVPADVPGRDGAVRRTPPANSRTLDPFVALTAAAMATRKLLVGTGICLLIQRDPIHTAKEAATLDLLSGGRFLFGVGGGWDAAEMGNHGTAYATRWRLLRERIEAMRTLWTSELASYSGQFVQFDRVWQWPKPVQKPHPPILVGGNGARTLQRVVRYGDEWLPGAQTLTPDTLTHRMAELQNLAQAAGRAPIPVSLFGCPADRDLAARYRDCGLHRLTFAVPNATADEVLPFLDRIAGWRLDLKS